MGSFSIWHWLIVLVVVLILFGGRGKISQLMGDFGRGLKSFKKSMRDDDESFEDQDAATRSEPRALPGEAARPGSTDRAGADRPGERVADRDQAARS